MTFAFPRRGRQLAPGQRSELTIVDLDGKNAVILTADEVIEAPNWSPDGNVLVFNAGGRLFRIGIDGSGLEEIDTGHLSDLNNDHVIGPDGETLYVSSGDGHLYALPFAGGTPRRVSNMHQTPFRYYLHGISPDGATLSYVAIEERDGERRFNLFTIPADGGPDARLTDFSMPNDGPEFSPDGQWIYFNSEFAATQPGHAQLFRLHLSDVSNLEQLTFDERVNWFPHVAPDGEILVYLSYPPGTLGHPPDKDVELRMMPAAGGTPRTLVKLFGGQGSINVNSWAPDSRRFAYIAYPSG